MFGFFVVGCDECGAVGCGVVGCVDGGAESEGPVLVLTGPVQDEISAPTRVPMTVHRARAAQRILIGLSGPGILPTSKQ
jgi:hypothetical protein